MSPPQPIISKLRISLEIRNVYYSGDSSRHFELANGFTRSAELMHAATLALAQLDALTRYNLKDLELGFEKVGYSSAVVPTFRITFHIPGTAVTELIDGPAGPIRTFLHFGNDDPFPTEVFASAMVHYIESEVERQISRYRQRLTEVERELEERRQRVAAAQTTNN